MQKLVNLIIEWAKFRGIFSDPNPYKQSLKTLEECGELIYSIGSNDKDEIKDAIGDIIVTLIIQCEMQGLNIDDCIESAYNIIKDRKGKMIDGQFVKDK